MLRLRSPSKPGYREVERLADDEVLAALQTGCHDALAVLFDRYHRLVLSIALRIVRDAGEAEDVTQIVFLDIFKAAAQFDPTKGTTKAWVLQYAYHRAISRRRHLTVRNFYSRTSDESTPIDPATHTPVSTPRDVSGLAPLELRDLLEKALASLSDVQRSVIERASFDGLTMREIADETGESLVNVRHHYYRGLRKLRAFVERQSVDAKVAGNA
jgi:RNA polymerase sigma-70 factor (ECF subfamily)